MYNLTLRGGMTKYPTIWYELLCESEYPYTPKIQYILGATNND